MRFRNILHIIFITIASTSLMLMTPLTSWADDPSTCQPPAPTSPGVHWPTGADAGTFTYQCSGPYTGEWTNEYYVFDPSTLVETPLYAPDYSYDCTSGQWTMTDYEYDAASGQYDAVTVVTTDPGLLTNCPTPQPPAQTGDGSDGSGSSSSDSPATDNGGSAADTTSSTGQGSNNTNDTSDTNNLGINNTTNLGVTNNLGQSSSSGDALVQGNTTAGDATSGSVENEANIINELQSSSDALGTGSPVITFTDNINGDVNGNLLVDPAALSSIQETGPNSNNLDNTNVNNNLTVNNSTGATINNNLALDANSGDATVSNNTSAGNATSGNAENVANIVNTIDSAINAGQSFIGTININGNLNGNILLPPDFANQLLADNVPTVNITGPNSTNSSSTTVNNNETVTDTNNLGINNSVNSSANSGAANVSNNTSAGSATSGNASTNITAFNLTGSNVLGANDLLVFVNVTGTWVGLIVNAPAGATAAELGGGISSTGPNSNNSTNTNVNNNSTVNNSVTEAINNNITTAAKSGDATVSGNTKGGNATSGNAENSINLLNMENSSINLSGWFGILFINVFGTWNGNFGYASADNSASTSSNSSAPVNGMAVFRFVPLNTSGHKSSGGNNSGTGGSGYSAGVISGSGPGSTSSISAVLASSLTPHINSSQAPQPQLSSSHSSIVKTAVIIGSLVAAYIVADALYTNRAKVKEYIKTKSFR